MSAFLISFKLGLGPTSGVVGTMLLVEFAFWLLRKRRAKG